MSTISKHLKSFILAICFVVGALAQQPSSTSAPSVERLRSHLEYLASDKLAGRRTGSQGATNAARYIADEFKRLGLKPARREVSLSRARGAVGHYDSHLQPFPYVAGVELGKKNALSFTVKEEQAPVDLRIGHDWMPLGFSSKGISRRIPATFVGYGITAADLKHDDYAKANVKERIAIALSGTPDGDNPHGQFARYEGVRWKAIAARNAGATALLIVARAENFQEERLARLRYDNSGVDAGLPVVVISRRAAAQLLQTDDAGLGKLEHGQGAVASKFPMVDLTTDIVRREVFATNVVGILDGSDSKLKNEAIVIGAHYDHLGLGGEGSLAPKEGEIHHGADDNASGTAGMLELARLFTAQNPRPRRTIVFIAFGGEEEGLLGSNYYVNHPSVPLAHTVAMINMDMIGRLKNRNLIIGGIGTAPEWRPIIEAANAAQGMTVSLTGIPARVSGTPQNRAPIVVAANGQTIVTSDSSKQFQLTLNEDGFGPSDHSSFYAKQIPVLFFWTGTHEDYHKPSDTADKINYEDEARILSLVARIVRDVDGEAKRPTYAVAKGPAVARTGGFSVSLGTIPNYGDSSDGLLIDGVREDSPAAKTGIKAGDKIVKLASRDIRNVYDYTAALGEMRAGQEYDVELMRGSERLRLKIVPAARR